MNQYMPLINIVIISITIAVTLLVVSFCFWTAVFIPIKKKKDLEDRIDEQKVELEQIQIQKGVEWDSYKDLVEESDKMRSALIELRKSETQKRNEIAKLETDKEKMKAYSDNLKKEIKKLEKKQTEDTA